MSKKTTRVAVVADDPGIEFTIIDGPSAPVSGQDHLFISAGKAGKVRVVKKSELTSIKLINDTGLEPTDYNCVVRLDKITDDAGEQVTDGGIIITKEKSERDQMAETVATLLAAGGNAFGDFKGRIPKVGDRVMISKYSGITREANPLDLIRVCKDKEILAVLT